MRHMLIGGLALAAAVTLTSGGLARGDELLQLGRGLNVRAEHIERDGDRDLRVYLPSLLTPLIVPQLLAQAAGARTGGSAAAGTLQLSVHGSNTIGSELMVNLIRAYANANEADVESREVREDERELLIKQRGSGQSRAVIELHSHGSATAFTDLAAGRADLGMASRAVKKEEVDKARSAQLGDLKAEGETVIGLDGLAIIVNRKNPISALPLNRIAQIFSGQVRDWAQVDAQGRFQGAIKVYARDERSGTWTTFKDLVLDPAKSELRATERFEDSKGLVEKVESDPLAIGFVGLAYAVNVKTLAVVSECGLPSLPSSFSIKTEEYPLSRRLYLYTPTPQRNALAQALLDYVKSDDAQAVVKSSDFVNFDVEFADFDNQAQRFAQFAYLSSQQLQEARGFVEDVRFASRASVTFHFPTRSDQLDAKAMDDVRRLAKKLTVPPFDEQRFLIIGFASDKDGSKDDAKRLSEMRALAVAQALRQEGVKNVYQDNARGYGLTAPVTCNSERNQRVEVWLQK
jgi:phosphate transport system substrate-binding protein